jgi:hypothetical protein
MPGTSELPPIELWWPHLEIPSRQWLVGHVDEPLPDRIIAEIGTLCDVADLPTGSDVTLSAADRGYIATQIEEVD